MTSLYKFPRNEQDTSITFDPIGKKWHVYSSRRKHINQLVTRAQEYEILTIDENGKPTSIDAILNENQVRFFKG